MEVRIKFSAEHTRERLANNRMDRKSQKMHGARKEKKTLQTIVEHASRELQTIENCI